ncbi:MAG TPA: methylcobamide--CoM methyltransferase [bacterium]|nr:methylcobamide--CoM methyltransferase [bacterium]
MKTTVVGSYPKIPDPPAPGRWRTSVAKRQLGEITPADLRQVEDEVTSEVLAEMAEAGVDLLTDGQIRWEDGQTYFAHGLEGFEIHSLQRYFDTNVYYRQPVAVGEIGWRSPIGVADYRFAAAHSLRPVKPVVTGPLTLAVLSRDEFYGNLDQFVMALAAALNHELRALAAAGAPVIQVDEPGLLTHRDRFPLFRRAMDVLWDGVTATRALYTYFGHIDGLYPAILEIPVDIVGVDFVAGTRNWEVLRRAKFTKQLGLGILDARNTKMETPEAIAEACRRAAEIVPAPHLHVGPSAGLEFLPRRIARRKLEVLVAGVRRAGKEAA